MQNLKNRPAFNVLRLTVNFNALFCRGVLTNSDALRKTRKMKKNTVLAGVLHWFHRSIWFRFAGVVQSTLIRNFGQMIITAAMLAVFSCTKTSVEPEAKPIYGLLPVSVHGSLPTRDAVVINAWSVGRQNYITNIVYDTLFSLNINHRGIGIEPVPYTADTLRYKDTLNDIVSSIQPAAFYTIENEEQHFNGDIYHSEGITAYCNELKAASRVFKSEQTFTNGGYSSPVEYWYYAKTHDEDFKAKVIPNVIIQGAQNEIDSTEYEMNIIRSMPKNFVNNVHLYIGYSYQAEPLLRMCNYIKQFTGHDILSNEAGIYQNDPRLISDLMTIATGAHMKYMIFYSGDGSGDAYPITTEQIMVAQNKN